MVSIAVTSDKIPKLQKLDFFIGSRTLARNCHPMRESSFFIGFNKMIPKRKGHPRGELVHGYLVSRHPLRIRFKHMLQRCFNPDSPTYKYYGARGITVCERWLSFKNYALDMGLPPYKGATIDRRNNDGNYEPSNCRWADRTQQALNRRILSSNTSGATGICKTETGYFATYAEYGTRFHLGSFSTIAEAVTRRDDFILLLHSDPNAALSTLVRNARCDSGTGIKGITNHWDKKGNHRYLIRRTINGTRFHIGSTKDLKTAVKMLENANA